MKAAVVVWEVMTEVVDRDGGTAARRKRKNEVSPIFLSMTEPRKKGWVEVIVF